MKTIYKSENGKAKIMELHERQLLRLTMPYTELFIDTSFGNTHIIETGNLNGEPLLVFTEEMQRPHIIYSLAIFY